MSEEESVAETVEPEEPNPVDVAEDKRDDEELNGILRYKYLIVGGGTASYAAIQAIRKEDPDAEVSLLVTWVLVAYHHRAFVSSTTMCQVLY